jgi:branched-chain amino acid aminotransferase
MIYFQSEKSNMPTAAELIGGASFQYGLTPFETIRAYASQKHKNTLTVFALRQHIERLFRTLKSLNICLNYREEEVLSRVMSILRSLDTGTDYLIKIMVFTMEPSWGNAEKFDLVYIISKSPRRVMGAYPVKLLTGPMRRARSDISAAKVKVGANYVASRPSQRLAQRNGYHLSLFLNDLGLVSESSGAGILAYSGGTYYIPNDYGTALDSITLDFVSKQLELDGKKLKKVPLTIHDLYNFDALFLVGTSVEILEVQTLDLIDYDMETVIDVGRGLLSMIQDPSLPIDKFFNQIEL